MLNVIKRKGEKRSIRNVFWNPFFLSSFYTQHQATWKREEYCLLLGCSAPCVFFPQILVFFLQLITYICWYTKESPAPTHTCDWHRNYLWNFFKSDWGRCSKYQTAILVIMQNLFVAPFVCERSYVIETSLHGGTSYCSLLQPGSVVTVCGEPLSMLKSFAITDHFCHLCHMPLLQYNTTSLSIHTITVMVDRCLKSIASLICIFMWDESWSQCILHVITCDPSGQNITW